MDGLNQIQHAKLVLYDGHCALCHWAVRFLLRQDKKQYFKFLALHSNTANSILKGKPLPEGIDSILYLEEEQLYTKSDAILRIVRHLPSWKYLYHFRFVPKYLRDGIYDFVAKVRYSIFGRTSGCPLPGSKYADRFID